MPSIPTREYQKKRVRWATTAQCETESTCSSSSTCAHPSNSHPPSKATTRDKVGVEGPFMKPPKAPTKVNVGNTMTVAPSIPALHPILSYFVFNWDVRASQFPDSLPKPARDEPAFPSLPYPKPVTVCFDTPLGTSTCTINPLEDAGKPVPISVGRVLACISRELYKAIEPTALYAGHALLPAVRQAAASRAYDPEPDRAKRVARNVDLYPVAVLPAQRGASLFFWYIELQHCPGGTVRLVARFGHKALKAVA